MCINPAFRAYTSNNYHKLDVPRIPVGNTRFQLSLPLMPPGTLLRENKGEYIKIHICVYNAQERIPMSILSKQKQKKPPKREIFLKKSLLEAQRSLENAYTGLDAVDDPDMIDSYIYELNAAYLRYSIILRDMRELTSDEEHQIPQTDPVDHFPTLDLASRYLRDSHPVLNTFGL